MQNHIKSIYTDRELFNDKNYSDQLNIKISNNKFGLIIFITVNVSNNVSDLLILIIKLGPILFIAKKYMKQIILLYINDDS